jgi:hypothetical protein
MLRSDAIQRWWPTTQALDLVEGTPTEVAEALCARVRGFVADERLDTTWVDVACFDDALRQAADFGNVPTTFVVLPTRSRWSVLWNNGFLCNGYDTLCLGLTRHHGLTTVHWCAHDATTTFQPGASFCHQRRQGTDVVERRVTVASDDGRWHFFASGEPLPEEQPAAYAARRTRGRLDERLVAELLALANVIRSVVVLTGSTNGSLPNCSRGWALPRGTRASTRSTAAPSSCCIGRMHHQR